MDFDEGEAYHECEEDEHEDTGIDMADAMQQASAWGMDDDLEQDEGDDTAAGSAGPVSPIRRAQAPLPLLSTRKRNLQQLQQPSTFGAAPQRTTAKEETHCDDACGKYSIETT